MVSKICTFASVTVIASILVVVVSATAQPTSTQPTSGIPDNSRRVAMLKAAMEKFDARHYDSALVLFDQAYALDTSRVEVRYEMALCYAANRSYDTAEKVLKEIVRHPKATDKYYQLLSNIRAERDDTAGARAILEEGVQRFPQSGRLRMERGLLRLQARQLDEALDEFEEGIQVDPGYHLNYYWAARSYSEGTERIWTLLYGEVLMNVDPNPSRLSVISELIFRMHLRTYDDFKNSGFMRYSRVQKGSTDAASKPIASFEDRFCELMTQCAKPLRFFQDFEIPLMSIDTLQTLFVKAWYKKGYDTVYPNAAIERHKSMLDNGYHTAYTMYLMQFAKPLEAKAYFDAHKKDYNAMLKWMKQHPFTMTSKNRFGRYLYE